MSDKKPSVRGRAQRRMRGAATEQQRVGRELTPSSSITSSSYDVLTFSHSGSRFYFFVANFMESIYHRSSWRGKRVRCIATTTAVPAQRLLF